MSGFVDEMFDSDGSGVFEFGSEEDADETGQVELIFLHLDAIFHLSSKIHIHNLGCQNIGSGAFFVKNSEHLKHPVHHTHSVLLGYPMIFQECSLVIVEEQIEAAILVC